MDRDDQALGIHRGVDIIQVGWTPGLLTILPSSLGIQPMAYQLDFDPVSDHGQLGWDVERRPRPATGQPASVGRHAGEQHDVLLDPDDQQFCGQTAETMSGVATNQ